MNFRGAKAYIQWETSKIKGFPAKVYIGIRGEVVGRAFWRICLHQWKIAFNLVDWLKLIQKLLVENIALLNFLTTMIIILKGLILYLLNSRYV